MASTDRPVPPGPEASQFPQPPAWVTKSLRQGQVIPAHPLALTAAGELDETHQRALARYYLAAGAGGLAVGVHTTQFEIRQPQHGFLLPVLTLAAETAAASDAATGRQTVLVAGICGPTTQAVAEARQARELGYHVGMISLAALPHASVEQLVEHCRQVAREIPIFGFYLQTAVGGQVLPLEFWRRLTAIPNLVGIKMAPFDRYKTLDVVRAVAESGRHQEIPLYTGNDDAIVLDLLTEYQFPGREAPIRVPIVGGLLGHWACWTRKGVELLEACRAARQARQVPGELLTLGAQVTEANAALFDTRNAFRGCIAGIHYVLQQQGLLKSIRCLNPAEGLSAGQQAEIERIREAYPHLTDDLFVQEHLDDWLK